MDDDLGVALFQETSIFIHILVLKPMVLGILSSFEKHPRVLFEWFGHIFSHLLAFWWSWNPDESWKFVSHQTSVWSIWHPTVNGIANGWFDCRNTVLRRLAVRNLNRTWVESSDDELGMCSCVMYQSHSWYALSFWTVWLSIAAVHFCTRNAARIFAVPATVQWVSNQERTNRCTAAIGAAIGDANGPCSARWATKALCYFKDALKMLAKTRTKGQDSPMNLEPLVLYSCVEVS